MKALLVEKHPFLGGVAATGLPILAFLDRTGKQVVKGIGDEMIKRLTAVGGSFDTHIPCPIHNSFTPVNPYLFRSIAVEMCEEAGVSILFSTEIQDVQVTDGKITGVTLFSRGVSYQLACDVLIDATGDGTAAYMAGADYEMGNAKEGKVQPVSLVFSVGNVDIPEMLEYLKQHPETFATPDTYGEGIEYTLDYFLELQSF
jgi:flavin-dependent dehydrogenase